MRTNRNLLLIVLLAFVLPAVAQDTPVGTPGTEVVTQSTPAAATNAEELRKAAQNPIASLISVPVQNNTNFGIGPDQRNQDVLNIQPVIPVKLTENWNLITRIITPLVYQPTTSDPINQGAYGFGDLNPSFFFSPSKPHKIIWGLGPTFVLPSATNPVLGQGKWDVGPSVVVLAQPPHWTLGALANNVFSFAGQSSRPDVNQFLLQYFINYNMAKGWYLTTQPILTSNWEVTTGRWVVPFGGGVGQNHEARLPADEPLGTVLWQRRSSGGHVALGHEAPDCVPVPQADQGTDEDDDGAETETVGPGNGATAEAVMVLQFEAEGSIRRCWEG